MNSREHFPKIGVPFYSFSNSTRSSVSTWLTRNFMVWWMLWTSNVKCLLVGECYIYIHVWVGSTCRKSTPISQGHCWRNLGWEQTSWCRSGTNTKVLHTGVTSFVSHCPFVSCLCGVAVCLVSLFRSWETQFSLQLHHPALWVKRDHSTLRSGTKCFGRQVQNFQKILQPPSWLIPWRRRHQVLLKVC